MICKNCGSEIAEDMRFCDKCGAAVEKESLAEVAEPIEEAAPAEEIVAEAAPAEDINLSAMLEDEPVAAEVKKPKKNRKGLKIVAIVLAVLVLLGGVAFLFRDKIEKIVVGFSSPERQLQYTYAKAAGDLAGSLFEGLAEGYLGNGENVSGEIKSKLTLSDEFKALVGIDSFVTADSLDFDYKIESNLPVMRIVGTLKMGGVELFGIDVYSDVETGETIMSMPGISDKYIDITELLSGSMYEDYQDEDSDFDNLYGDMLDDVSYSTADADDNSDILGGDYSDLFGEEEGEESNSFMNYLSMLGTDNMEKTIMELLPSGKQIEGIVKDVTEAALDAMRGVTKEKTEFTAGGVTQKATCLKAEVTEKVVSKMAVAALKELKTNGKVKKYINGVADELGSAMGLGYFAPDASQIYSYYQMAIEQVIAAFKTSDSDKLLFTLNTWIDSDYNILAIELALPEQNKGSFFLGHAENGSESGFEFSARSYSGKKPYYIGGKTVENGKNSGTNLEVARDDTTLLTATAQSSDDKGTILINFADELSQFIPKDLGVKLSDYALKIEATAESDEDVYMLIAIVDAKNTAKIHAGLSFDATLSGKVKVKMIEADTDDITEWEASADLDGLMNRLKQAGISEKLFEYMFVE